MEWCYIDISDPPIYKTYAFIKTTENYVRLHKCYSSITLPFFSIFFLQGLVAIRSILTFKKLGIQDDERNAIKVEICSLCLLYIFPKDPM